MKDRGVLHPQLAQVLASVGHGDRIGLADAGLPIPGSTVRIDLAFAPGKPALLEVFDAVVGELRVESYLVAEESLAEADWLIRYLQQRLPHADRLTVSHTELKRATSEARAVVRTGEFRPFANVLLQSGVEFPSS